MRAFILGADGKPCIWPIPEDCTWNGDIFDIGCSLKIFADDEFIKESKLFAALLQDGYSVDTRTADIEADVKIIKCHDEKLGPEGYILDVTEEGVMLKANTAEGIYHGCMTLLQLIRNSPGRSIHGVHIVDKPLKTIRGVKVFLPARYDILEFKRFIDFLAVYKINRIIIEERISGNCLEEDEINDIKEYIKDRHIGILQEIPELTGLQENLVSVGTAGSDQGMEAVLEKTYEILKMSCISWWSGYKPDKTAVGCLLPDYLERIADQLYPIERDSIDGVIYPSSTSKSCKTFELRKLYNAPLYRLSWRPDDYDYTYLTDARYIPVTVPFSIFQGVLDFKLQHSFILAGNGWNQGIFNIPVGINLRSLVFLHSYILDKGSPAGQITVDDKRDAVGYYVIHYKDGAKEKIKIEYGKTISHWKADFRRNKVAYMANPVFTGIAYCNIPYIIYSQEWINARPDIEIEKIDLIPAENSDDGGIALFGITAVI